MKGWPGKDGFPTDFYQISEEELTPIFNKLFKIVEKAETLPNSFCEINITLIPNQIDTRE